MVQTFITATDIMLIIKDIFIINVEDTVMNLCSGLVLLLNEPAPLTFLGNLNFGSYSGMQKQDSLPYAKLLFTDSCALKKKIVYLILGRFLFPVLFFWAYYTFDTLV